MFLSSGTYTCTSLWTHKLVYLNLLYNFALSFKRTGVMLYKKVVGYSEHLFMQFLMLMGLFLTYTSISRALVPPYKLLLPLIMLKLACIKQLQFPERDWRVIL